MNSIIDRFSGHEGKRQLTLALQMQRLTGGKEEIATALADVATVRAHKRGEAIISQGKADNDIVFILVGRVVILVGAKKIRERVAGEHVGEMTTIDPSAVRSGTIVTLEETAIARVSEPDFSKIAARYPELWRCLAVELAGRVRQYTKEIRVSNEHPVIFIGSSSEGLAVAEELRDQLNKYPSLTTELWTKGVFEASAVGIESLELAADRADFAVLILSPDDHVHARGNDTFAPRDNVVFELGLFMGELGRSRTFIVQPNKTEIKIPTDLLGITTLRFSQAEGTSLKEALDNVYQALLDRIARGGTR